MTQKPILVTGATGYVGGRLVPHLAGAGFHVRAMGRSLAKLSARSWAGAPNVELAAGDVMDSASLRQAADGCGAAFYLVHSMIAQDEKFAEADRIAAENMAGAAAECGLERIIYLGGLGDLNHPQMSKHLRSRHEVGETLQAGTVPATVLRAAMILGSGSASFEILRYLVERLPVMLTPKWVHTPCQPISISSVLKYLTGCLDTDKVLGGTFDIGDAEILTYRDIIHLYAQEAGLPRRLILPVPVLTPRLSAYWIHLVTPVPSAIAMPLTEGLSIPVVCRDNRIKEIIPFRPPDCRETIRKALQRTRQYRVDTCWFDAGCMVPPEWADCGDAEYTGGTILNCGYRVRLKATPREVWKPVVEIGGRNGWYYADFLWRLRGLMDRVAGGIGLRRGRRHPTELKHGDGLDFWRVLEIEPPFKLVLLAEMKVPGEALLEFKISQTADGHTELEMLSRFRPRGLGGIAYWYGLYLLHELIFRGLLKRIAEKTGRPITAGPTRYTPLSKDACSLPAPDA